MSVRAVRALVAAAGVMLAVGICAGPAGATVIHQGSDSGTDHFTDTSCGFTLVVDVTFQSRTLLRVDKGGQAFVELSDDVHGPHPAFAPDFPFCDIAAQLTGA